MTTDPGVVDQAPTGGRVFPTIGIDPGQRWIGLAARVDNRCVDAATLDRGPIPDRGDEYFLGSEQASQADQLLEVIGQMMTKHVEVAAAAARDWDVDLAGGIPWRVAVEGIVVTGAYLRGQYRPGDRIAKLTSLVPVAVTVGVVCGQFPGVVVVHPRKLGKRTAKGHGDILAALGPYPKQLLRTRPKGFARNQHPRGDRVHERSAWAVAGAAQLERPLRLRRLEATG